MALRLEDKKAIVAQVNEVATTALSAIVADYRGLSVSQITQLRQEARDNGVYLRVVRNTLAKRALKNTEFQCLDSVLVGPTILAFSKEDPGAVGRVLKEFTKNNDTLKVKALSIGGQVLGAEKLDTLANMPTIDQARAMLMSVMLAPITKLVRTFNEFPASITRVVKAVADQKSA